MVFLTFEDVEETFEAVLFPDAYREFGNLFRKYRYLCVEGELNIDGGNVAVICDNISPAATGLSEKPYI